MHVRTLAASVCLLVLAGCGGGSAAESPLEGVSPPPEAIAAAAAAEGASTPDPLALSYWSAGRVAALEAAKSAFVPPPDVDAAAAALAAAPPAPVAAPDPAPVTPAGSLGPDPAVEPLLPGGVVDAVPSGYADPVLPNYVDPVLPGAPVDPLPPSPMPLPSPGETSEPVPTLPIEAMPLAVVLDRNAAVVIDGCTIDAATGQRRVSYFVELNEPPVATVRTVDNQHEHSPTSRTILVEETATTNLIAFVLVEDDLLRDTSFIVPAIAQLRITDEGGGTRTLDLPSAVIPSATCTAVR